MAFTVAAGGTKQTVYKHTLRVYHIDNISFGLIKSGGCYFEISYLVNESSVSYKM